MLGFAYDVPEELRGPGFATRTYESVRHNRPRVIAFARQVHAANIKMKRQAGSCLVYIAINRHNNKLYVGMTSGTIEKRSRAHFYDAINNGKGGMFGRAIRKYGKEAFEFLIFAICRSIERAKFGERELIADIMPEYNLTAGGEGMLGWKPTAESRKRMADAHLGKVGHWRGKKMPPELIAKRTKTRRERDGYASPWKGRKHDPETIRVIAEKNRGRKLPSRTPEIREKRVRNMAVANLRRSRPVECIADGKTFPNMREAATHYKIAYSYLQRVLKRQQKSNTVRGLAFRFIET